MSICGSLECPGYSSSAPLPTPCTVLVYVNDATSRLMHLLFVKSESTLPILKRPVAISINMISQ